QRGRYQGIIHDFVVLNALRGTHAAGAYRAGGRREERPGCPRHTCQRGARVLYGIAGRCGYALAVAEPRHAGAETRSRQELVDALRTAAVVKSPPRRWREEVRPP